MTRSPIITHAVFDESGDTGIGERSSRFLVVAGVACPSLQPLRRTVLRARKSFGKKRRRWPELKASHLPAEITCTLLKRLSALEVALYVAICDKGVSQRPKDPENWYRAVCSEAIRQAAKDHDRLIVTVDNRYTKATLRDRLVEYIAHGTAQSDTVLSFVHADSRSEAALQLADAVAWSFFQKYERGDDQYCRLVANRIRAEVLLQKKKPAHPGG